MYGFGEPERTWISARHGARVMDDYWDILAGDGAMGCSVDTLVAFWVVPSGERRRRLEATE